MTILIKCMSSNWSQSDCVNFVLLFSCDYLPGSGVFSGVMDYLWPSILANSRTASKQNINKSW